MSPTEYTATGARPLFRSESSRRAWTLVLASMGVFMTALDTLVVSTALSTLRKSLGASLVDLEWTVNAYNLAFACFLLTGAALGDRFGRRRMFLFGLFGFTMASAAAALSPNVSALIAARALQGATAGIVMPLTLTLISDAFPAEKRGTAIGLWGGITGLAVAAGPVVGGAIVTGINWHWIFWLNVPIGLMLIPLARFRLSESFGPRLNLDFVGLVLSGLAALSVTWGLVRASALGWGSAEVIGSIVVGVICAGVFVTWEERCAEPMLPMGLFKRPGFAASNAVSFFMYACLFGVLFLMSQFLQTALGYSPLAAGIRLLPWTAAPMVIAPLAGSLADRFGNRPFMTLGLTMQAVGMGWVALIAKPGVSYLELVTPLTVAGIGISMCFPTVANAVLGSVPDSEVGVASGVNSMLRELGGVFGVAVLASVFARQGVFHLPQVFINGFKNALWVGVGFSALGGIATLFVPGRNRADNIFEQATAIGVHSGITIP
jgi:EmrB/QacA subfamily drug resistance transporter